MSENTQLDITASNVLSGQGKSPVSNSYSPSGSAFLASWIFEPLPRKFQFGVESDCLIPVSFIVIHQVMISILMVKEIFVVFQFQYQLQLKEYEQRNK